MTDAERIQAMIKGPNGLIEKTRKIHQLRSIIGFCERNESRMLREIARITQVLSERTELWLRTEKVFKQEIKDLKIQLAAYEEMVVPRQPDFLKAFEDDKQTNP